MKRMILLIFLSSLCLLNGIQQVGADEPKKMSVVASLFPQYDFARTIAGDRVELSLLLPPGAESHTFDPRPMDVVAISKADLFLFTGRFMEPWAERLAAAVGDHTVLVDVSDGVELVRDDHDDHDHHDHGGYDPHFWLNPLHAVKMVENIQRAFSVRDPGGVRIYRANAERLTQELLALDREMEEIVSRAERRTLVFGSRFAYRYFVDRYGLDYVTAYHSCGAHAEPSVRDVMDVVRFVRENGTPCVYHEELVDPRVARTIADETGAELLLFSTAHNVSKAEFDAGVSFVEIMRKNIEHVRRGLE